MARLDTALRAMQRGLSPDRAALGLAMGAALGLFPVLGTTTILCVAAGTALGLNHAVLQTANYAVSLFYFPAFYAQMRIGEAVAGGQPLPLTLAALTDQLGSDPAAVLTSLGMASVHALLGWVLAAPLLGGTVYALASKVLAVAARRGRLAPAAAEARPGSAARSGAGAA